MQKSHNQFSRLYFISATGIEKYEPQLDLLLNHPLLVLENFTALFMRIEVFCYMTWHEANWVVPVVSTEGNAFIWKGKRSAFIFKTSRLFKMRALPYSEVRNHSPDITASYCRITESKILEFLSQNKLTCIFIQIHKRNTVQMLRSVKDGLDLKVPSIYWISCVSAVNYV